MKGIIKYKRVGPYKGDKSENEIQTSQLANQLYTSQKHKIMILEFFIIYRILVKFKEYKQVEKITHCNINYVNQKHHT